MLYNELRPKTLNDIIGNESIKTSLTTAIATRAIPHALLFTGRYGTGKSSAAFAFANSLGDAEVIKFDCGKDGAMDNVKSLVESSAFPSMFHKYKVYVLDEVQKLSAQAQNVLLDPIEHVRMSPTGEPLVIWILCTSEPEKLIGPLKSRTLSYKLEDATITHLRKAVKRILDIPEYKNLKLEGGPADWERILQESESSFRKFYTLIEILLNNRDSNGLVTSATVSQIIGKTTEDEIESIPLIEAVKNADVTKVLLAIDQIRAEKGDNGIVPTTLGLYNYNRKVLISNPNNPYYKALVINLASVMADNLKAPTWQALEVAILSSTLYMP